MELGALEHRLCKLVGAPVDLIPTTALRADVREKVRAEALPL